jgi:hypothetical protein
MAVGLGKVIEPGGQVEVSVRQSETANMIRDVGCDLGEAIDLRQIASHGSGTKPSDHSGKVQDDQLPIGCRPVILHDGRGRILSDRGRFIHDHSWRAVGWFGAACDQDRN